MQGSSPLARGLRGSCPTGNPPKGIIPARAGFTSRLDNFLWWCKDHPRSRGVYEDNANPDMNDYGSSPLARGLLYVYACHTDGYGIIPARAGFTLPFSPP